MSRKTQRTTRTEARPATIHETVLQEAIEQVRVKAEIHGDTRPSFEMIASLWSTYIRHAHLQHPEEWVSPKDVAQLMALLKIARSVYGDNEDHDNFVDGAAYTALAAMLGDDRPVMSKDEYDAV